MPILAISMSFDRNGTRKIHYCVITSRFSTSPGAVIVVVPSSVAGGLDGGITRWAEKYHHLEIALELEERDWKHNQKN
jgi:hypothetical protein